MTRQMRFFPIGLCRFEPFFLFIYIEHQLVLFDRLPLWFTDQCVCVCVLTVTHGFVLRTHSSCSFREKGHVETVFKTLSLSNSLLRTRKWSFTVCRSPWSVRGYWDLSYKTNSEYIWSTLILDGSFRHMSFQVLFWAPRADSSRRTDAPRRPNQPLQFRDPNPRVCFTCGSRRECDELDKVTKW